MPANILDDMYLISLRRKPWHNWATIVPTPHTAIQAGARLGFYDVWKEKIVTITGRPIETHDAVIRGPTRKDTTEIQLGLIERAKDILTPELLADCWDTSTGMPVETFGAVGNGQEFFMSGLLEKISEKGEDLELYLLLDCNYLGELVARVTHERVVCWNTLQFARNNSEEIHKIDLTKNPESQLRIVLADLPVRYKEKAAALREVFSLLRSTPVTLDQHKLVTNAAFPLPYPPKVSGDPTVDQEEEARYQRRKEVVLATRELTLDTFKGKGKGMDIEDTAWKSFNAAVEVIDWGHFGRHQEYTSAQALFKGAKAAQKERAWDKARELVTA